MVTKYKNGEVVFDRTRPMQKLIVTRYFSNLYYCKPTEAPNKKDLVYFERELMGAKA